MLGMYASLARSLICDLRLDRQKRSAWCPSMGPDTVSTTVRSNESRRALLACYALSGIVSTTLNYDIMPWSSQLEDDCDSLASQSETEGDAILVALAQISRIGMHAVEVNQSIYDKYENNKIATLHIAQFKASLDLLRNTLSVQQTQHSKSHHILVDVCISPDSGFRPGTLRILPIYVLTTWLTKTIATIIAFLFSVEISVYKLAIARSSDHSVQSSTNPDHKRTTYLLECLQSCKTCTECFISLDTDLIHSTMAWKLMFAYCAKVIYKLSRLQDGSWDSSIVHDTVDVVGLLEQCAAVSDHCNAQLKEETGEDSVFAIAAKTLRETAPQWVVPHIPRSPSLTGWSGGNALDLPLVDFPDEFWLSGVFNS
jgi:hypothetical protein